MFKWFRNLSIKVKIATAILLPVLGLLFYSGYTVLDKQSQWSQLAELEALAVFAPKMSAVVHEMQAERGYSAVFIGSRGSSAASANMNGQYQNTDKAAAQLNQAAAEFDVTHLGAELEGKYNKALSELGRIGQIRGNVGSLSMSGSDMAAYYTSTIQAMIEVITLMAGLSPDATVSNDITAYISVIQAKEKTGVERAMGALGFNQGRFDPEVLRRFSGLIAEQESYLWVFDHYASATMRQLYADIVRGAEVDTVRRMEQIALEGGLLGDLQGVRGPEWFAAITAKINLMKEAEDAVARQMLDHVVEIEIAARNAFFIFLAITIALLLVTLAIAYYVTSNIGKTISSLLEKVGSGSDGDDADGDELAVLSAAVDRFVRQAMENSRIRTALDNCQANVMVADTDLNIVYMNVTMVEMMKNAEADLKQDLPNLDTDKLMGTCVDVFHKNPSHQRGMIEGLTSAYETTIEVGGRIFDLIASPITDDSGTRLGTVVEWDDVTEKLAAERETQRIANENMRVRVALDNCAANVMVADTDYNIAYMNEAVLNMMRKAESDLKKDLPSFDANNLLGNSIDNFHKNPAHQRGMLEKLDSIYQTSITVGGRTFDLIANPIVNEAGERLGTVVEWNDVTLELAIQEEIDEVVQAVVAGDFTKSLSLEGKSGFFLNLSEAINGLKDNIENVLKDVAEALASLAQGNLTNRITADYQGTYETLKQDVNQTTERLAKTVTDIITAANEISNASSEIAAGGADLSQRTEQQASNLEETAASMEEMATTVKQNAENAQQANQLSITARSTAETGGEVVNKAVTAMAGIEESSQKVSDIIGVIDEIAFQTNLLALNAAVEAARAGEAGKGFAVVASEVRTLAQRSSEAAKDIKGLILDSDAQVKDGVQLVNQTGESLSEIVDSIKRVADIVSEIAAASGEQATGVEEINTAITNMDEMTQQNAALVEESSANARSLEEQSDHMLEMMGFFAIDGAKTAEAPERIPANNGVHKGAKPEKPAAKPEPAAPPKKAVAAGAAPADDEWEEF